MDTDDVEFFSGFVDAEDDVPEGEAVERRPAPAQPEFELEDIGF